MKPRPIAALAVFAAAMLTIVSCGGNTASADSAVRVDLDEWGVAPDVTQVSSGEVDFRASNKGSLEHEMKVLKTDLPADGLVVREGKVDEEASGAFVGAFDTTQLQPGQNASATWDLPPGTYVLFCNITGHYNLGMRASLTVN